MNFKYKVLGFVAAIGMAVGLAVPALAADNTGDNATTLTVSLNEAGIFNAKFSSTSTTLLNTNQYAQSEERQPSTTIKLQYVDTMSYRDFSFVASISATNFTGVDGNSIPATNMKILENHNPAQGRWSHGYPSPTSTENWADSVGWIGDIGATPNGTYVANPTTANRGCEGSLGSGTGYVEVSGGSTDYWNWLANDPGNNLGSPQTVACGRVGGGTAGVSYDASGVNTGGPTFGSEQPIVIQLTVPAGQRADHYTSTLTLTLDTATGI